MYTAQGTIDKAHLLEEYLPMVRRMAVHMLGRLPPNVELDDLVQAGRLGLIQAWERFHEHAAASFETFATPRVRGAMLDELRNLDWAPRRVRQQAKKIEDAVRIAAHRFGRSPTEPEIACELGLSLSDYHEQLATVQGCRLLYAEDLDASSSEGEGEGARDEPAPGNDGLAPDPMAALLSGELREHLKAAIRQLPEREAHVLSLYYEQDMNMREIADVFGVTRGRASQLHSQAIVRLRAALKELM